MLVQVNRAHAQPSRLDAQSEPVCIQLGCTNQLVHVAFSRPSDATHLPQVGMLPSRELGAHACRLQAESTCTWTTDKQNNTLAISHTSDKLHMPAYKVLPLPGFLSRLG